MFKTIRWRVAIPSFLLLLVAMPALGVYLLHSAQNNQIESIRTGLVNQTTALRALLAEDWQALAEAGGFEGWAVRWGESLETRVTIVDTGGVVLGESLQEPSLSDNHLSRAEFQAASAEGLGSTLGYSPAFDSQALYIAMPVLQDGQTVAFLRLAHSLEQVEAGYARLRLTLFWVTGVLAVLAGLFTAWIASRATRSLRHLRRAAEALTAGDLEARADVAARHEVGDLARAFDRMADRLQEQIESLRAERSKLAVILGQMHDGVVIADPEGKVVLLNKSAEQLFEIGEGEAVGRSLAQALRYYQMVDLWRQCRDTGHEQVVALELPNQRFWQAVASPLEGGLADHTLLLLQDLTRTRRLETVRRDFISNISHELRTPLASLKALAETLRSGALEDPTTAELFLERIETEVDALILMVNELLELARIESGRVPLNLSSVSPGDVLQGAVDRLRLQAEQAGLSVQLDCPDDLPPILADAPRLEQVLVNLIHNAIKFTALGGTVWISAHLADDGMVCFAVRDNGVGIPSEDLSRVFERFYKADRARSGGGTGLGLAIARHLVEAHGGRLWAESVQGQGSTFYLTIPLSN